MDVSVLQDAGLTAGEARAYLALNKLGLSSVGAIAENADLSLSKIYEVLDGLIKKGLVSTIIKNNIKYFQTASPEKILDYLKEKRIKIEVDEQKVREIIPLLEKDQLKMRKQATATLYEGLSGIKTFYEELLKEAEDGETIYVYGLPKYSAEKYRGYFLDWNKRRAKKGIPIEVLYNSDVREEGQLRAKIRLTKVRYLPKELNSPSWILVYKDIILTAHILENPICVVIRDKEIAESHKSFFRYLWKISKK